MCISRNVHCNATWMNLRTVTCNQTKTMAAFEEEKKNRWTMRVNNQKHKGTRLWYIWYINICLKVSSFSQDTPQYNNLNTKHQGMHPISAFRKNLECGQEWEHHYECACIHVWTWTRTQTQCRHTTESILPFWTVNRKWNKAWIFPLYEWLYTFLVPVSHTSIVTPEGMPPTRGDFGHGPFLNLKGSLDIMSIHMGLLYL